MTVPSVLLVPGAWHGPQHLRLLIDELADLQVHTVALPSTGDDPAGWATVHQIDGVAAYTEHKTPEAFYNDVDPRLTEKAIAQLGYQSYAAPH